MAGRWMAVEERELLFADILVLSLSTTTKLEYSGIYYESITKEIYPFLKEDGMDRFPGNFCGA